MNTPKTVWLENDQGVSLSGIAAAKEMGLITGSSQIDEERDYWIPEGKDFLFIPQAYHLQQDDLYEKLQGAETIIAQTVYVQNSRAMLSRFLRAFRHYSPWNQRQINYYSISGDYLLNELNNMCDSMESTKHLGNAIYCASNHNIYECEPYMGEPKKIIFDTSKCEFIYEQKSE